MISKPMLASSVDSMDTLKYPLLATPKLDGIRCLIVNGKALTRSFKPIPNMYIRYYLEASCPNGFDGEIVCPNKTFNQTQSIVMSEDSIEPFTYIVFDYVKDDLNKPYVDRMKDLLRYKPIDKVQYLLPEVMSSKEDLELYHSSMIQLGYEGTMVRTRESIYKCGRATAREQFLMKIKNFIDDEAIVVGYEEYLTNTNEKTEDNFGYSKRASNKANLVPANKLGALILRDSSGCEFKLGTGFTDNDRIEIWNNREDYMGRLVTYMYQKEGKKDKPRFPSFKGFRSKEDL